MEESALTEAWDWLDEELELDSEFPLVVSQSLWDDFAHNNESVVRNLFACSPPHAKEAVSSAFSFGKQDSPQTSSSWHIAPECNPPPKRRRMLQLPTDEHTITSPKRWRMLQLPTDEHTNTSPCLSESFENCSGSFIEVCGDHQANGPSSPTSMWFMANEESLSSVADDTVEQSAESWMAGCFGDSDAGDHHGNPINAGVPKFSPARATAMAWKNQQACRWVPAPQEVRGLQQHGAKTKQSADSRGNQALRPTAARGISKLQVAKGSPKPVVYPFALVKPCGIQGDATLKDINQRINMASPSKNISGPSNKASPSSTSSPFSGKSVLALTKIHTEGKGTITIMRTRS